MDNFKAIYKILRSLECAMDFPLFDIDDLNFDGVNLTRERLYRYFEMLQDAGLVKGADLYTDISGETQLRNPRKIRITLAGLEYLQENSIMRKMYQAAKGIADLVP